MPVRSRPMRPKDVRRAVEMVAADSIVGPRYDDAIRHLASVWLRLLGTEAFRHIVLECPSGATTKIVGVGVSAFVSDAFFQELKTPPFFWAGPEIARRITRGVSPVLSDQEVRRANSEGGLNVVVWEGVVCAQAQAMPEAHNAMLAGFIEQHRGFLIKELLGHGTSAVGLRATFHMGNLFLSSRNGSYIDYFEQPPEELLGIPHFIGVNRELARSRVGTWVGALFDHQPPRFAFRPSEMRLLVAALRGGTDDELSDELCISLSAVKKTWLSIYERVGARDPNLVPSAATTEEMPEERGKGKKQHLLVYLREHPEEIRPAAL